MFLPDGPLMARSMLGAWAQAAEADPQRSAIANSRRRFTSPHRVSDGLGAPVARAEEGVDPAQRTSTVELADSFGRACRLLRRFLGQLLCYRLVLARLTGLFGYRPVTCGELTQPRETNSWFPASLIFLRTAVRPSPRHTRPVRP